MFFSLLKVSSKAVQELRRKSGAGMMDCKKALAENNMDMEKASDWLRKKVRAVPENMCVCCYGAAVHFLYKRVVVVCVLSCSCSRKCSCCS